MTSELQPYFEECRDRADHCLTELDLQETREELAAVAYVDIVGSTALTLRLHPKQRRQYFTAFGTEMHHLAERYEGRVLKVMGDGLVTLFPAAEDPAASARQAAGFALGAQGLTREVLTPLYAARGLPTCTVRIALDMGHTQAVRMAHSERRHEFISPTLHLAAKILQLAGPGQVLLGESLQPHLPEDYRARCRLVNVGPAWRYLTEQGEPYRVYELCAEPTV